MLQLQQTREGTLQNTPQHTPLHRSRVSPHTHDRINSLKEKYSNNSNRHMQSINVSRRSTGEKKGNNSAYYRKIGSRQRGAVVDNILAIMGSQTNAQKLALTTNSQHNFNRHNSTANLVFTPTRLPKGNTLERHKSTEGLPLAKIDTKTNQFWKKRDDLGFEQRTLQQRLQKEKEMATSCSSSQLRFPTPNYFKHNKQLQNTVKTYSQQDSNTVGSVAKSSPKFGEPSNTLYHVSNGPLSTFPTTPCSYAPLNQNNSQKALVVSVGPSTKSLRPVDQKGITFNYAKPPPINAYQNQASEDNQLKIYFIENDKKVRKGQVEDMHKTNNYLKFKQGIANYEGGPLQYSNIHKKYNSVNGSQEVTSGKQTKVSQSSIFLKLITSGVNKRHFSACANHQEREMQREQILHNRQHDKEVCPSTNLDKQVYLYQTMSKPTEEKRQKRSAVKQDNEQQECKLYTFNSRPSKICDNSSMTSLKCEDIKQRYFEIIKNKQKLESQLAHLSISKSSLLLSKAKEACNNNCQNQLKGSFFSNAYKPTTKSPLKFLNPTKQNERSKKAAATSDKKGKNTSKKYKDNQDQKAKRLIEAISFKQNNVGNSRNVSPLQQIKSSKRLSTNKQLHFRTTMDSETKGEKVKKIAKEVSTVKKQIQTLQNTGKSSNAINMSKALNFNEKSKDRRSQFSPVKPLSLISPIQSKVKVVSPEKGEEPITDPVKLVVNSYRLPEHNMDLNKSVIPDSLETPSLKDTAEKKPEQTEEKPKQTEEKKQEEEKKEDEEVNKEPMILDESPSHQQLSTHSPDHDEDTGPVTIPTIKDQLMNDDRLRVNKLETMLFKKERYLRAFKFYVSQTQPQLLQAGVLRDEQESPSPRPDLETLKERVPSLKKIEATVDKPKTASHLTPTRASMMKQQSKREVSDARPKLRSRPALLPQQKSKSRSPVPSANISVKKHVTKLNFSSIMNQHLVLEKKQAKLEQFKLSIMNKATLKAAKLSSPEITDLNQKTNVQLSRITRSKSRPTLNSHTLSPSYIKKTSPIKIKQSQPIDNSTKPELSKYSSQHAENSISQTTIGQTLYNPNTRFQPKVPKPSIIHTQRVQTHTLLETLDKDLCHNINEVSTTVEPKPISPLQDKPMKTDFNLRTFDNSRLQEYVRPQKTGVNIYKRRINRRSNLSSGINNTTNHSPTSFNMTLKRSKVALMPMSTSFIPPKPKANQQMEARQIIQHLLQKEQVFSENKKSQVNKKSNAGHYQMISFSNQFNSPCKDKSNIKVEPEPSISSEQKILKGCMQMLQTPRSPPKDNLIMENNDFKQASKIEEPTEQSIIYSQVIGYENTRKDFNNIIETFDLTEKGIENDEYNIVESNENLQTARFTFKLEQVAMNSSTDSLPKKEEALHNTHHKTHHKTLSSRIFLNDQNISLQMKTFDVDMNSKNMTRDTTQPTLISAQQSVMNQSSQILQSGNRSIGSTSANKYTQNLRKKYKQPTVSERPIYTQPQYQVPTALINQNIYKSNKRFDVGEYINKKNYEKNLKRVQSKSIAKLGAATNHGRVSVPLPFTQKQGQQ